MPFEETALVLNANLPSGASNPLPLVDANELQAVKSALTADNTDAGVGVLHLPTNRIHLRSTSQTKPPGHNALVRQLALKRGDCRGFVIVLNKSGDYLIENISGLNSGSGGMNNLQMSQTLFEDVKQALMNAAL
jgi:hypothetical protein